MAAKHVLVTGSTGQQGGAVARLLLKRGHKVRALVRNPGSDAAIALAALGAEVVQGSLHDGLAVAAAAKGVDAIFGVTTPFEAGMDAEVRHGRNIVDAADGTGAHLVFSSVAWAYAKTGIPHFESKWKIEEYIRALDVPHTIAGPAYFMDNTVALWAVDALRGGTIAVPLSAGLRQAMIAVSDIAAFAVYAIENRDRMVGRRVDLAADQPTGEDTAAILSQVTGRTISYYAVPIAAVRSQSEDLATMFDYYEANRPTVDIVALKHAYPDLPWLSYEQWATAQDWTKVFGAAAAGA